MNMSINYIEELKLFVYILYFVLLMVLICIGVRIYVESLFNVLMKIGIILSIFLNFVFLV